MQSDSPALRNRSFDHSIMADNRNRFLRVFIPHVSYMFLFYLYFYYLCVRRLISKLEIRERLEKTKRVKAVHAAEARVVQVENRCRWIAGLSRRLRPWL